MPNGIDKNWYRMCSAINSFRVRFGHWPTRIRLSEGALENLFSQESYRVLLSKLEFIFDGSAFIAEDDQGRSHNYAQDGFVKGELEITAQDWLGVEPDSAMVREYYGREDE
jgi:hypothetical protein